MPEPARPIPVKLDAETLAALDALVAAGRQPTRSAAIRAGIELLLQAEHRRALDLGLPGVAAAAGGTSAPARPVRRATGAPRRLVAAPDPAPAAEPERAPEPPAAATPQPEPETITQPEP